MIINKSQNTTSQGPTIFLGRGPLIHTSKKSGWSQKKKNNRKTYIEKKGQQKTCPRAAIFKKGDTFN